MHLLRERRRRKRSLGNSGANNNSYEAEKFNEEKKTYTRREAWTTTPNDAPNILKKKLAPLRSHLQKQRQRTVCEQADCNSRRVNRSDTDTIKQKSGGWNQYNIAAGAQRVYPGLLLYVRDVSSEAGQTKLKSSSRNDAGSHRLHNCVVSIASLL